jgi:2-polyprenyl-6-methoxyphenol hydroxylase-like FAD-dependent oxidoreductase
VADTDVIIVGAGPTGLMLAAELRLAGPRPLVLERRALLEGTPRASGLNGRILQLLRYRGLLDRLSAAGRGPIPAPAIPFGGMEVDLTGLADAPLQALHLPQPQLEQLLDERARELGAEVRRGHRVTGLSQDPSSVTAEVRGPDGRYRMTGRYLVGCDGAYSLIRSMAGIPFPGTTYPEVNRLGQITVPESVTTDNGDLKVPGLGPVSAGFTRTDRGVFAFGPRTAGDLLVQTTEDETAEAAEADADAPMTLAEFRDSIRRVLGVDLPVGEATRLSRYRFQARQAERYLDGRILLAGDAAHQFPATGIGLNVGMLDAVNLAWKLAAALHSWAPGRLLETYHDERHFAGARAMLQTQAQVALRRGHDAAADALREVFAELCADEQPLRRIAALVGGTDIRYPLPGSGHHALTSTFAPDLSLNTGPGTTSVAHLLQAARPVLLVLADRPELRRAARGWRDRIDIRTAGTESRPADALLIRPDAYIAWAAATGEPTSTATATLRNALSGWFGAPGEDHPPLSAG